MELAIAVLCWVLAACLVVVSSTLAGWLVAQTELANARAQSEKRLHS